MAIDTPRSAKRTTGHPGRFTGRHGFAVVAHPDGL